MNGAPEKPMTPAAPSSSPLHQADGIERERHLGRVERPERGDVGRRADRPVDDRPDLGLDPQTDAHRLERQHDVGEQDGRVDAELADRHQRDLGAQVRGLGELQDPVALAELPVGGERPARLAHEPDRRGVDRLAPAGAHEAVVHAALASNATRAAAIVASISAGPWAIDGNHASNCDGGRNTPWSSIEPKKRAYAARSAASASAASVGTVGRKKTVSSGPTRAIATGHRRGRRGVGQAGRELGGGLLERDVAIGRQLGQGRDPGRHRQRMARQRARLVDRTRRRDEVHQVGPAAVCTDRHPAADDLAERRQVGRDAEPRLRPAEPEPEAGDDLVEDEQGAVGAGRLAEVLEEPRLPAR